MSYDLMVFERTKAPQKRKEFLVWYDKETEWSEEHGYDDPAVTSPALRNWYEEMIKTFPNMDSPDAEVEDDDAEAHLTEYCIGHNVIYVAFAWSVAEEAYEKVKALAHKHGVGFYDVSNDDGEIILPDGNLME
ncbi:MAG: enolase [Muribaculaceae bacterium]